ncbi:MAG: SPOR domain-containing protein [Burkholderiaceae bacterium]|nr:SPOR domain-containing protein [Burkholderiaceae bacterium]
MKNRQRGGTILGFILGLLLGLGSALAVAVYVAKVPVPFLNKNGVRGADQDAAEAQKNKNWDPNSPLYGKNPVRVSPPPAPEQPVVAAPIAVKPVPAPSVVSPAASSSSAPAASAAAPAASAAAPASAPASTSAAQKPSAAKPVASKPEGKPSADPLGDLATAKAAAVGGAEPFDYFVQAGAFRTQSEADAQRAKLAMLGWEARVSEREQNGRTVFRVRVGPFAKRDDAAQLKEKLDGGGMDAALVRVSR